MLVAASPAASDGNDNTVSDAERKAENETDYILRFSGDLSRANHCKLLLEVRLVCSLDGRVFYKLNFGHDGSATKEGYCTCAGKWSEMPTTICRSHEALVWEIMRFQKHVYDSRNPLDDAKKMLRVFLMEANRDGRDDYSLAEFQNWLHALVSFKDKCMLRLHFKNRLKLVDDKVWAENETLKARVAALEARLATSERYMKTHDLVNRSMAEQTKIATLVAHEGVYQAAVAKDELDACKCELEKEKELHAKCRADLADTVVELAETKCRAIEMVHEVCERNTVCMLV